MHRLTITLSLVLMIFGSAHAFDGQRKGLLAGIGVGFSPSISWNTDSYYLPKNTDHVGFAANGLIGLAIRKDDLLVFEGNMVWYSNPSGHDSGRAVSLLQSLWALSWYHYFGPPGKSAFVTLGVGPYVLSAATYDESRGGVAMSIGGGYEFAKHLQVGVYYVFGEELHLNLWGNDSDEARHCHHLSFLLTAVGY